MNLLILGNEGIRNANIWYPTILGVLVVVAAVFLFIGATYLLLATNTGARLAFLLTAAALSGMMLLLSTLWWTTASPLNTLKGRVPHWVPVESIKGDDLARSDIPAVQEITKADQVDLDGGCPPLRRVEGVSRVHWPDNPQPTMRSRGWPAQGQSDPGDRISAAEPPVLSQSVFAGWLWRLPVPLLPVPVSSRSDDTG